MRDSDQRATNMLKISKVTALIFNLVTTFTQLFLTTASKLN